MTKMSKEITFTSKIDGKPYKYIDGDFFEVDSSIACFKNTKIRTNCDRCGAGKNKNEICDFCGH